MMSAVRTTGRARSLAFLLSTTLLAALSLSACSDSTTTRTLKPPGDIRLNVISGSQQYGAPNTTLPKPIVVQALSSTGTPIAGQVVNFRITAGGGSMFAGVGITNSNGYAQDYWTLGPTPGVDSLEARAVDPTTGARLVFAQVTATAVSIASITVSPSSGSVAVGGTLQLVATAKDSSGNVVSVPFTWTSNSAAATVSSSGLVTGVASGSATITASAVGKSGSAAITVGSTTSTVASVSVTPTPDTLTVGQTLQLTSTAKDASGNVISGATTTWASSNTGVATVSSTGAVSAVAAGSVSISATVSGVTGTASVTDKSSTTTTSGNGQPALVKGFFNTPSGMTVLSDVDFSTMTSPTTVNGTVANTWYYQPNITYNYPPWSQLATDPTSPSGNSSVFQFDFPTGWPGGHGPAIVESPGMPDAGGAHHYQEMYWGFYWKADTAWQDNPTEINKIGYGWLNNSAEFGISWLWWTGTINGVLVPNQNISVFGFNTTLGDYLTPNQPNQFSLVPGNWYKIEWYIKLATSSTSNDGVVKVWVNDQLTMYYTNEPRSGYISDLYFDPVWGGNTGTKTQNDFFRIAHAKIAVR